MFLFLDGLPFLTLNIEGFNLNTLNCKVFKSFLFKLGHCRNNVYFISLFLDISCIPSTNTCLWLFTCGFWALVQVWFFSKLFLEIFYYYIFSVSMLLCFLGYISKSLSIAIKDIICWLLFLSEGNDLCLTLLCLTFMYVNSDKIITSNI